MAEVRIPAKVMLSGEYAVLFGGSAVMTPVPRWLIAQPAPRVPEEYPPAVRSALEEPLEATAAFEREHGLPKLVFGRSGFYENDSLGVPVKLGLGSSAAETVAVLAMRYEHAGLDWPAHRAELLRPALQAHRRAQLGLGSGADVAGCLYGRPLRFSRQGEDVHISFLTPPSAATDVPLALAWTGVPADSRVAVWRFEQWARQNADAVGLLARLVTASHRLASAWFTVQPAELFGLHDEFVDLTLACTAAAGVDYLTPEIEQLQQWARERGGRAKPTGAGGGDFVLLLGDLPVNELPGLVIPLTVDFLWPEEQ